MILFFMLWSVLPPTRVPLATQDRGSQNITFPTILLLENGREMFMFIPSSKTVSNPQDCTQCLYLFLQAKVFYPSWPLVA